MHFQPFSCDDHSEILKEWIAFEHFRTIKQAQIEDQYLAQVEALETVINANEKSKNYFSQIQNKIASDLNFRNSLPPQTVEIIMSLQLD